MNPAYLARKHWVYAAVLAVGLVVAVVAFRVTSGWEAARADREFEKATIRLENATQARLDSLEQTLRGLQGLYAASSFVDREGFSAYAQTVTDHSSSVQALEWIPRVTPADRDSFEAAAVADGLDEFVIRERTDSGALALAGQRDAYYPVFYVEPLEGNEAALGFDLGSESVRRTALEAARDSGSASVVLVELVQERGTQTGMLLFVPVYDTPESPLTVPERRTALDGFVLGVYRVGDLLAPVLADAEREGLTVSLRDVTNGAPVAISTGAADDLDPLAETDDDRAVDGSTLTVADRT